MVYTRGMKSGEKFFPGQVFFGTLNRCTICLKECPTTASDSVVHEILSFCRFVSRYFNVNLSKPSRKQIETFEHTHSGNVVYFHMCENCRVFGNKCVEFYKEMEVLQMKLHAMGQEICDLIIATGQEKITISKTDKKEVKVLRRVRKEIKLKCSMQSSIKKTVSNTLLPVAKVNLENIIMPTVSTEAMLGCAVSLWIVFSLVLIDVDMLIEDLLEKQRIENISDKLALALEVMRESESKSQRKHDRKRKLEESDAQNPHKKQRNENFRPQMKTVAMEKLEDISSRAELVATATSLNMTKQTTKLAIQSSSIDSSSTVKEETKIPNADHPFQSKVALVLIPKTVLEKCDLCDKTFSSRGLIEKHRVIMHNLSHYVKCPHCSVKVLSYHNLELHRKVSPQCQISEKEKRYEKMTIARPLFPYDEIIKGNLFCSQSNCCEVFDSQTKLQNHIAVHGAFKCGFGCKGVFSKGHELAIHEVGAHGTNSAPGIECPRCGPRGGSGSKIEFIKHFISEHLQIRQYLDPEILRGISTEELHVLQAAYNQKKNKMKLNGAWASKSIGKSFFTCELCKIMFLKEDQYSNHNLSVHKHKNLKMFD